MLNVVHVTETAIARDPSESVGEPNDIVSALGRIVEPFGCEGIETIGDAHMAVAGVARGGARPCRRHCPR